MPPLTPPPRIRLSRLRDIGWRLWDPIGLLPDGAAWQDPDHSGWADEYDGYLVRAASELRQGTDPQAVVAYLCKVETEHMGLSPSDDTRARALAVVRAILADAEIWTAP